jgi:hypothetical protein
MTRARRDPMPLEDMMFFFSLVLALFVLCMDSNAMSLCFYRQLPGVVLRPCEASIRATLLLLLRMGSVR